MEGRRNNPSRLAALITPAAMETFLGLLVGSVGSPATLVATFAGARPRLIVQTAQYSLARRDDGPVPASHGLPLGRRSLERLDPQPISVGHEAELAELERGPHRLDRIVDWQITAEVRLDHPDEDVVDGAHGVDQDVGFGHGSGCSLAAFAGAGCEASCLFSSKAGRRRCRTLKPQPPHEATRPHFTSDARLTVSLPQSHRKRHSWPRPVIGTSSTEVRYFP
jgi:hypothetical protein